MAIDSGLFVAILVLITLANTDAKGKVPSVCNCAKIIQHVHNSGMVKPGKTTPDIKNTPCGTTVYFTVH